MLDVLSSRPVLVALCALSLLGACSSEPAAPDVDGGADGGVHDSGGGDSGGSDGGVDAGGVDAGDCVDADCDDGNPCNGVEACGADGACAEGDPLDDGSECDIDDDPATRDLCVDGLCGPSRCGDTFVDAGEDCDDGNDVDGDGCDACAFSCADATDCDDGNPCTGTESCGTDHICAAGTPAADGTACGGTNVCMGGACVPSACTTAGDCDNGLRCDGVEGCGTSMTCEPGTAVVCDDGIECTADSCSESGAMCLFVLVDADGDGHAPASLGACGTDCDDTDATINPDAVDVCGDTVDNDCNGTVDDGGMTTYYADCDGDDYAVGGATGITSCGPPALSLTGCATGGAWTARVPASAMESDCNDANPAVSPGQDVYQTTAIAGAPEASDFDYDCSSTESRQYTMRGGCMRVGLAGCLYTAGWQMSGGTAAPACGVEGTFIDGCSALCTAMTSMRLQPCL